MYYKFKQHTLLLETTKISSKVLLGVGMSMGLLITLGFTSNPSTKLKTPSIENKPIVVVDYNEFTEDRLIEKIKQLNFRFPHIVLAQSYQETGHYKSNIFLKCKNLFGMKQARARATLAQGTSRGHAYYDSWQESLYDYALFYNTYLHDVKSEKQYFDYLERNYAQDPAYVKRLKVLISKRDLKNKF